MNVQSAQIAQRMGISNQDYAELVKAVQADVLAGIPVTRGGTAVWSTTTRQIDAVIKILLGEKSKHSPRQIRTALMGIFRHRFDLNTVSNMSESQTEEMFALLPSVLEMMGFNKEMAEKAVQRVRTCEE